LAAEIEQGGSVNEVITYAFDAHEIVVKVDGAGDPWFSLPAICRVTGHTNPSMAGSRIPDDEKTALNIADPNGRLQPTMFVNEAGMYRLVLTSRLHAAERFKTWIVREVLPSIRKTGGYGQPVALNLRDPRQMATIAAQLAQINEELNGQLAESQAQASRRLRQRRRPMTRFVRIRRHLYAAERWPDNWQQRLEDGPARVHRMAAEQWGFCFIRTASLSRWQIRRPRPVQGQSPRRRGQAAHADLHHAQGPAHFHRMLNPQGDLLS
jgi:prophage antirepressor-like protein